MKQEQLDLRTELQVSEARSKVLEVSEARSKVLDDCSFEFPVRTELDQGESVCELPVRTSPAVIA